MRVCWTLAVVLASIAGAPCGAFGQAIAGAVRDSSEAVLPDVTVQAQSAALIEKTRTAVTDGSGQYRIADLRPGLYTITFRRDGFQPLVREAVEVTTASTTNVNVLLQPGAVTNTITVTGQTPAVDVQSATTAITLRGDVVKSLPTVRGYNALVVLIPGIVTSANDVVTGTTATQFPIHGGRSNEGRLSLDGLTVGGPSGGNSPTSYVIDTGAAEEVTFAAAAGLGETETGGLVVNIVPKAGGNARHGSLFASGTSEKLASDNLTSTLKNQGVMASPLSKVYDVSATAGGPVVTDRAWYFITAHRGGSTTGSTNVHYNLNAGDPTKWLYAPDVSHREYSDRLFENASARATWQLVPGHKLGLFWDEQVLCRTCTGTTSAGIDPPRVSPEAAGVFGRPLRVVQAIWSAAFTNRVLVEAGFGGTYFGFGNFQRNPNPTRDLIRVVEQCANGCDANGSIPGLAYRSQDFSDAYNGSYLWKGSVSYVTGSHSMKAGYQRALMTQDVAWMTNNENLTYRFNNGIPNQLTESISPWVNSSRTGWDAIFAQERWTRGRLTLEGALRFDRARSWFPVQREGPSRFLPSPIVVPETRGVDSYRDITPRMGAAYDVLGDGRIALKAHLGRYLDGAGTSGIYLNTNPTMRMPQTTSVTGPAGITRTWLDANGNFVPDCDLLNPNMQDLRAAGGDLCGVMSNTSFGQNVLTNNFDPAILHGWGVRPSDWTLDVSIQQQVLPRAALTIAYSHRWFHGFTVADNLALQPSDLTPFSVVAPADPRLPGGGGYTVSGLYDVAPDKSGQVSNLIADASKYGTWYQYFNAVDATFNLRATRGFTAAGGTSTGQTVADNCDMRAHLPEVATTTTGTSAFGAGLIGSALSPVSPYCHVAYGIQTQFRGLASYDLPAIGVQLSATFQSKPGALLASNYAVPNSAAALSLGRNLSGNAPNVTVNLVAPGTLYGDRVNQLDVRAAKIIRLGHARTALAVEIYNALNSSAVLSYNNAFAPGGTWLQPIAVLTPRFFKISADVDF